MTPVILAANQPQRFYRGGPRIQAFRRQLSVGDRYPEDWIASATTLFGEDERGLTRLPSGALLRDAIAADAVSWLGPDHVARHGASPALLVKLLDAGQRLPVHAHPDRAFARRYLGSAFGKTEGWVILEAAPGAVVHLGFRTELDLPTMGRWVFAQDRDALLASMNEVEVRAGDAVFVPAGTPHAVGEGILLLECQEPTDFSVLLEWEGFAVDGLRDGHLGLGFDVALQSVDRRAWRPDDVRAAIKAADRAVDEVHRLPEEAASFFTVERLRAGPPVEIERGYRVLVVANGVGRLLGDGFEPMTVARGTTVVIPWSAGVVALDGDAEAYVCRPSSVTVHEPDARLSA